jgi:hypothetical protein
MQFQDSSAATLMQSNHNQTQDTKYPNDKDIIVC